MATYILLSTLTDEGRKTLTQSPERLEQVNHELAQMGARLVHQVAAFGPYDFINVVEAPDNETITRVAVELGSRGTIRITTLPAFPAGRRRGFLQSVVAGAGRKAQFVVFAKLNARGKIALRRHPERLQAIDDEARRLGATVIAQYRVLGEHDFVTFAEAPDNQTAHRIATEISGLGAIRLHVYPAIEIDRFVRLLKQKAYRTEPHAWQTQPWASALRRLGRYWVMTRHARRFCRPFTVEGAERLQRVRGPALIIANHSSHFDTPVVLSVLPTRLRERTAVAAAADRFYRANMRSWWFSLFWNSYPIARGGGMEALNYSLSLLKRGWSILIYPEGGRRSKPGQIQRFRHGVTILAQQAKVPVVPIYMEGLSEIMPRGQRSPRPAPVRVRIGDPVTLDSIESIPEGTALLERSLKALMGAEAQAAEAAG